MFVTKGGDNMSYTLQKRDGSWRYRVFYYDANGVRRVKSKSGFVRRAEADTAAQELERLYR